MPTVNMTINQLVEMNKLFELIDNLDTKIPELLKNIKQRKHDLDIESQYRYLNETKYGHCNIMQFEYLLDDIKQIKLLINPIYIQMNNSELCELNHHQIE